MQQENIELAPELLVSCSEIVGVTSFHQYLYVFLPQKIAIYEHLTYRSKPELIQQIHLPHRSIRLFDISEDFIAVLFVDGGLEVRKRGYWEVMVYEDRIHERVDQLQISGNKIMYRCTQSNAVKYGFIDLKKEVQQRFWDQLIPFEKLIFRHQLGTIPDFFIGYHMDKKVEFGMLYGDEGNILKKFEFGILPENYHLKDLLLTQVNQTTWLIQISEYMDQENGENEIHINVNKFYEHQQIERAQLKESEHSQDKKLKIFENMLFQMQQIQKNMNCSPNENLPSIQPLLQQQSQSQPKPPVQTFKIDKAGCYQNCFIKNNEIWVCMQKQVHRVALGKNQLASTSFGKSSEKIMNIYDECPIYESRSLMVQCEKVKPEPAKMNQNLSSMSETTSVGIQTQQDEVNLSDSKKELSISHQIIDEKYAHLKESKNDALDKKAQNEGKMVELTERLFGLNKNIEKHILKTIYEFVKEEHEKVKQSTATELKRFVQNLISKEVVPIIDEHISEMMNAKMKEASEYIEGLAGRNLINMNEQIQKERIKEEGIRNMYLMKQADEIHELKRIVEYLIAVCKKKQCQKLVLFSQMKESIEKLSARIVSLQEKVDFLVDAEELKETKMFDEIQLIKSMIKSKHLPTYPRFDNEKKDQNSQESLQDEQSSYEDQSEESAEPPQYPKYHPYQQHPIPQKNPYQYVPVPPYQPYVMPMQHYPPYNYQPPQIPYIQSVPSYQIPQELSMGYGKGQNAGMNHYYKFEDYIEQEGKRKKRSKNKRVQRKKL